MGDPRWRIGAGLVAAAVLLLVGLGRLDLWAPDEPRLAAVAEEARSFEYGAAGLVLLHLNGAPYTQKPPLYYWLAAAAGTARGRVDEWAARAPSALSGLALIALTYVFMRRLGGSRRLGLLSGALLLTSFRFLYAARRAQLDVLLALCETLALLLLHAGARAEGDARARRRLLLGAYAALGAAALVKGPVGWLPLPIIAVQLAWEGRRSELRRIFPLWGFALAIAPVALWIAGAAWLAPPGFLGVAVGENLLGRFFAGTSHARPFYYFLYQLPVDALPWTVLWPAVGIALHRSGLFARAHRPTPASEAARRPEPLDPSGLRLLVCWVAVPFLFFSLSAGKRSLYLLPIQPALAMLCAWGACTLAGTRLAGAGLRLAIAATALLGGALAFGPGALATRLPEGFEPPVGFGWGLVGIALALATVELVSRVQRARAVSAPAGLLAGLRPLVVGTALVYAIELASLHLLLPAFDAEKSPRPIAEVAAAKTRPNEAIGVYAQRALEGGLGYYADRPIASLPDAESVRRFVADGGRVIVARASHWKHLVDAPETTRATPLRAGDRAIVVLEVAPPREDSMPKSP